VLLHFSLLIFSIKVKMCPHSYNFYTLLHTLKYVCKDYFNILRTYEDDV